MFGGQIRRDLRNIPALYHLNNFNDFPSSMITLFSLMVVNNWMVTTDMYVVTMGSGYYRWFFGIYFLLTVVMGMNIIVAFALDVYSSVDRLD